jgi:hypothetical protein
MAIFAHLWVAFIVFGFNRGGVNVLHVVVIGDEAFSRGCNEGNFVFFVHKFISIFISSIIKKA